MKLKRNDILLILGLLLAAGLMWFFFRPGEAGAAAVIMQNGQIKANVTRSEVDESGKTLEDLFFEVTEGIDKSSVSGEGEPQQ